MKKRTLLLPLLFPMAVLGVISFATVAPIEWRPPVILGTETDRALAFALLGAALSYTRPRAWPLAALAIIAIAGGLELMQLLTASRHAHLSDAVVKAMGGLIGIAPVVAWQVFARQTKRRQRLARAMAAPLASTADFATDGMQDVPVTSRAIQSVQFGAEDGRLRIAFASGEIRMFEGLTEGDVAALVNAPSPGRYYMETIRTNFRRLAA